MNNRSKYKSIRLKVEFKPIGQKDIELKTIYKRFSKIIWFEISLLILGYITSYVSKSRELIYLFTYFSFSLPIIMGGYAIYLYRNGYRPTLQYRAVSNAFVKMKNPNIFERIYAIVCIVILFIGSFIIPLFIFITLIKQINI